MSLTISDIRNHITSEIINYRDLQKTHKTLKDRGESNNYDEMVASAQTLEFLAEWIDQRLKTSNV